MRAAIALTLGLVSIALGASGCLEEDDYVPGGDAGASGSPAPGRSTSSSASSGSPTSSSGGSTSGAPAPLPPPPQPIPEGCYRDGAVLPAGPAPSEIAGDCFHDSCDGKSRDGLRTFDATDVKKDDDPCLTYRCTTEGSTVAAVVNGVACGSEGGVCFLGHCTVCKPANAATCAAEGGNEPANDQATSATAYQEYATTCGFSSGDDVDWYTFHAEDHALSNDVFDFQVWSTAPTVEICIFVKCGGGTTAGGCSGGKSGPNGSHGCCWSGAPASLRPRWDMDCAGTSEDSGTAYVSVRTPGGDACEPYLVSGHY